ncbi:MAG: hypothetical protein MAG453_00213 [Calditrichaeota bacterium]|nr:hypothetical protein [Calditrichota bacterium]
MRASSAITFSPAPISATHPDLEAVVEQAIAQYRRGWLHETKSISVTISPPWGNAWLFPIDELEGDEAADQVEWELQQRLSSPLEKYIYAWNKLNGKAYAIVIRPELLSFWEDLFERQGIDLESIYLSAGIVDEKIEREADLLPLLHLWKARELDEEAVEELPEEEHHLDLPPVDLPEAEPGEEESEPEREREPAPEPEPEPERPPVSEPEAAEMETGDIIDAFGDLADDERARRKRLIWATAALFVILIAVAGWLFRDTWLDFVTGGASVEEISAGPGEEAAGAQEPEPEPAEPPPVQPPGVSPDQPASPAAGGELNAGRVGRRLFELAREHNVSLSAVIFQGSELIAEAGGDERAVNDWRDSFAAETGFSETPRTGRGGEFSLTSFAGDEAGEMDLSVTQFDQWMAELGIQPHGAHAYHATRAQLDSLFALMSETGRRPWRLSVHDAPGGGYYLMMLP